MNQQKNLLPNFAMSREGKRLVLEKSYPLTFYLKPTAKYVYFNTF
jgi:hypothetical protein